MRVRSLCFSILLMLKDHIVASFVQESSSEFILVIQAAIPAPRNSRVFLDSNYEFALPIDAEIPRLVVRDEKG
jgi:hypothetical protein